MFPGRRFESVTLFSIAALLCCMPGCNTRVPQPLPIVQPEKVVETKTQKPTETDQIDARLRVLEKCLSEGKPADDLLEKTEFVLPVLKNGQYGFINANGQMVVPPCYDGVKSSSEGFTGVNIGGKWTEVESESSRWMEFIGGIWGFVDNKGQLIVRPNWTDVGEFAEGMAWVNADGQFALHTYSNSGIEGGRYGFINNSGKLVVPLQHHGAQSFSEGLAAVKKDDRWGYINPKGEMIIPAVYSRISDFHEGMARIEKKVKPAKEYDDGYRSGYINNQGVEKISPQYYSADQFNDGLAPVCTLWEWRTGVGNYSEWTLVDTDGKAGITQKYDFIDSYSEGYYVAERDDKFVVLNQKGKELFVAKDHTGKPLSANTIVGNRSRGQPAGMSRASEGFFSYKINAGEMHLNTDGPDHGFYFMGGQWGCMDAKGKTVVVPEYDYLSPFKEGFAIYSVERTSSEVNEEGYTVENSFTLEGFLNMAGEKIIPPTYSNIFPFKNGIAKVEKGEDWNPRNRAIGYINSNGIEIWPPQK